jgi:CubicO group peptidase (beta-lactamase class C family)
MSANRPARGSAKRGERFWYNNWDFNALCTIFEQESGTKIFEEFERRIAKPLRMQDFSLDDTNYLRAKWSAHPAYLFDLSARDLARFGLLFARGGNWRGEQLVPEDWVRESTAAHWPETGLRGGYGYMWWAANPNDLNLFGVTTEPGAFMASGSGGQRMLVLPQSDLVVVHRVANTPLPGGPNVNHREFAWLLGLILSARPDSDN